MALHAFYAGSLAARTVAKDFPILYTAFIRCNFRSLAWMYETIHTEEKPSEYPGFSLVSSRLVREYTHYAMLVGWTFREAIGIHVRLLSRTAAEAPKRSSGLTISLFFLVFLGLTILFTWL